MKIRSDFVTNSSSSSFTVRIAFKLADGKEVSFEGTGGTESGREDYFDSNAFIYVSPKELGEADSVDQLIMLLQKGVLDYEDPIFDGSNPQMSDADECRMEIEENDDFEPRMYDAYDFIVDIINNIHSVDDIKAVEVSGKEENYGKYYRVFFYDKETGEYTGVITGEPIEEIDGSNGGDIRLKDLETCSIEYRDGER